MLKQLRKSVAGMRYMREQLAQKREHRARLLAELHSQRSSLLFVTPRHDGIDQTAASSQDPSHKSAGPCWFAGTNSSAGGENETPLVESIAKYYLSTRGNAARYTSPGMMLSSPAFRKCLGQDTIVYCSHHIGGSRESSGTFSSSDMLIMNQLIKHPECLTQSIVLVAPDLSNVIGFNALIVMISNSKIKKFALGNALLPPKGWLTFFTAVWRSATLLEALVIEGARDLCIDDGASVCGLISDFFFCRYGKLRSLAIVKSSIDDTIVINVSKHIGALQGLTSLNLSGNMIEDDGVIALSEALESPGGIHCSLQRLDMSNNRITSMGGQALSRMLAANRSLEYISLSYNLMLDDVISGFVDAVDGNPVISNLEVEGNLFREEFLDSIRNAISERQSRHDQKSRQDDSCSTTPRAMQNSKILTGASTQGVHGSIDADINVPVFKTWKPPVYHSWSAVSPPIVYNHSTGKLYKRSSTIDNRIDTSDNIHDRNISKVRKSLSPVRTLSVGKTPAYRAGAVTSIMKKNNTQKDMWLKKKDLMNAQLQVHSNVYVNRIVNGKSMQPYRRPETSHL